MKLAAVLAMIPAILRVEGATSDTVRYERDGSCSVGRMQVNVRGCDDAAVRRLLDDGTNMRVGRQILATKWRWCRRNPANTVCLRGGAIAAYNPGDPDYPSKVRAAWRAIVVGFHRR